MKITFEHEGNAVQVCDDCIAESVMTALGAFCDQYEDAKHEEFSACASFLKSLMMMFDYHPTNKIKEWVNS